MNDLNSHALSLVVAASLRKPETYKSEHYNLCHVCLSWGNWKLSTAINEYTTVILSREGWVDLVDYVYALQTHFLSKSEWSQKIHCFSWLWDAQDRCLSAIFESQVLYGYFGRLFGFNIFETSQLAHQVFSVLACIIACSTGCQHKIINLSETLFMGIKSTQPNHSFIGHKSWTVIKGLLHTVRHVQHLHNVKVIYARWLLNSNFFLLNRFYLLHLDLIMQRKLNDFSVLDVVKGFRIVLKNSGIACHDLEFMSILITFRWYRFLQFDFLYFFNILNVYIILLKSFRKSNHNCACVFEDIHIFWLQDWN